MKSLGSLAALLLGLVVAPALAGVWPTEIDRIARLLESSEVPERRAAASRLTSLPPKVAAALLPRAIDDPDIEVRLSAVTAMLAHRLPAPEERVLTWMNEQDARIRLAACMALSSGASAQGVAVLARALNDADLRVRQAAAVALGNSGLGDGVVALLGHLDDPAPEVRSAVVDALWKLGDPRAVVPLAGKVQDSSVEVRRAVVRALGELGDRRATNALILALRDSSAEVRVNAMGSLGQLADPSATAALIPMSEPQQPLAVRRAALEALGRMGTPREMEILVRALEQDGEGVENIPARQALIHAGSAAIPVLLKVLEAPPSERTARGAAEALGKLGAKEALKPLLAALRRGALPATSALRALRGLQEGAALPVVLELLEDRLPDVRNEARQTLRELLRGNRPQGQAVDPLVAALNNSKLPLSERAELVRLLGATGASRATQILAPLISSPPLRLAAIEAVGLLGPSAVPASLLEALDNPDGEVRLQAGIALALAGGDAEASILLDRLISAQQQDRAALTTALAGTLGRASSSTLLRAGKSLDLLNGAARDALLEGLGRSSEPEAITILVGQSTSKDSADRRKVAESLGGHPDGREHLRTMLSDVDVGVRANAAWALGAHGTQEDLAALEKSLGDSNTIVSSNAMTSIGRILERLRDTATAARILCPALEDRRAYGRAGALSGLLLARSRCLQGGEPERKILLLDPSPIARAAAADLLQNVPSTEAERDRRVLSRCRREDPYGSVAVRCAVQGVRASATEPVVVLIVPDGSSQPVPGAPFALRMVDQRVRHGFADRRGAVFERFAPVGTLRLEVPAALSH